MCPFYLSRAQIYYQGRHSQLGLHWRSEWGVTDRYWMTGKILYVFWGQTVRGWRWGWTLSGSSWLHLNATMLTVDGADKVLQLFDDTCLSTVVLLSIAMDLGMIANKISEFFGLLLVESAQVVIQLLLGYQYWGFVLLARCKSWTVLFSLHNITYHRQLFIRRKGKDHFVKLCAKVHFYNSWDWKGIFDISCHLYNLE